jgi:hypothetical protein
MPRIGMVRFEDGVCMVCIFIIKTKANIYSLDEGELYNWYSRVQRHRSDI